MREAILEHHPTLALPTTTYQDGREGQLKVDAIWITPEIPILAGTWLSYLRSPHQSHRDCLIDVHAEALVGEPIYHSLTEW